MAKKKQAGKEASKSDNRLGGSKYPFWARPQVGSLLTVVAAICFLVQLMILPLVGPCGTRAPHRLCNLIAFSAMLLVTSAASLGATFSKLSRRRVDGSPLPLFSFGLCAGCVLIWFCLLTGLFAI